MIYTTTSNTGQGPSVDGSRGEAKFPDALP
jgi:hypothetical protein